MKATSHLGVHGFHLVVLALTNFSPRLVLLVFVWTLLGCAPVIYVQPTGTMSFQQTLEADAVIDARSKAHALSPYARAEKPSKHVAYLDPAKLPEAYTLDGTEGSRASQYHLGYAALRLIRAHYADAYAAKHNPEKDDVEAILEAASGNVSGVIEENRNWRVDIADIDRRFVFEVVPPGQIHLEAGKKKADLHAMLLNAGMWGRRQFKHGVQFAGEVGVRFAEKTPPWKLSFSTVEPGVIQYRWQVLTVRRATDEAHQQAYIDDQWHDPTPYESAHLSRALHLVVERLVQAREALGQIRAREEMPMLPGKTMGEYLRALSLWSAHDDRIARLMPIMREVPARAPPPNVRRDMRFIGETVIPQVPNEGYTTDGKPGSKPPHFHLGSSAHKVIAMHYKLRQEEPDKVAMNFMSIKKIVDEAKGKPDLVLPHEALLRPDIADWGRNGNVVFEIKPDRPNYLVEGQTIVATYLAALNRGMVGKKPFTLGVGFHGNVGVMFADGLKRWNLTWRTASPGVILYKLRKLGVSAQDQAIAEAIKRAQDEGRWVDLTVKARIDKAYEDAYKNDQWVEMTDAEMEPYAKQLEDAVDMIVADRQLILDVQDVMTGPIEVTGQTATIVLTAELSRLMSPPKPQVKSPAKLSPGSVPPPAIPQNDNGVPLPAPVPAQSPRAPPAPVYKPKKAG